ncbi:MAG: formylglycine-generating enzyme family protein [Candidatus Hydrogenedentes bacterium]|nr:formylglycine-generating enzyme family protein [Candidatus Hydrogenedentota bacterium]
MLTLTAVVSVAVIAIMAVFVRMLLTPPWPADFPQTDFVWIAPGEFTMGSPDTEAGREPDETQYRVTLSSGYWLAKYEVTQEQWQAVMGANPAIFATLRDPKLPIENVSWDEVQLFIKKLNAAEGTDFRLPTEAEWEYGCRAGTSAAFSFGEGNARLGECAWYKENGQTLTHPVGTKQPNALGLYDMHGNVKEWCQDWAGPYPVGPATDPQGPETGTARIYRGGSWGTDGATCRSADRSFLAPTKQGSDLGFRLCR